MQNLQFCCVHVQSSIQYRILLSSSQRKQYSIRTCVIAKCILFCMPLRCLTDIFERHPGAFLGD